MNGKSKYQILFYQDNTVRIPLKITELLNSLGNSFNFSWGKASIDLPEPIVADDNPLSAPVLDETKNCYLAFIFTNKKYKNNYFFDPLDHRIIVSFYGWRYLTSLPIVNAIPYFFAFQVACKFPFSFRHLPENIGCVYDFWEIKTGIDQGLRASFICGDHMTLIEDFLSESPDYQGWYDDVMQVLGKVADASRRNKNIVTYHITDDQAKLTKPTKQTRLPFYCKSNSNWLSQSKKKLIRLEELYQSVRKSASSKQQAKGKVFEQFCVEFFTLIKGWKVVAENPTMPDCEVDIYLDISEGPELLRRELGNRMFVEAKHRGKPADVQVIDHLFGNMSINKIDSSILCSYGGITGYNPEDILDAKSGAMMRIKRCFDSSTKRIITFTDYDIDLVRKGRNIVELFRDKINAFHTMRL